MPGILSGSVATAMAFYPEFGVQFAAGAGVHLPSTRVMLYVNAYLNIPEPILVRTTVGELQTAEDSFAGNKKAAEKLLKSVKHSLQSKLPCINVIYAAESKEWSDFCTDCVLLAAGNKVFSGKPYIMGALPVQQECVYCHTPRAPGTHRLSRCSDCKLAAYCSRECQRADWPYHKSLCRSVPVTDRVAKL